MDSTKKSPGRGWRRKTELDGQTEPTNYCLRGSDGMYCFQLSFFLCTQDNLWTAALSSMKFSMNMLFDNRTNPVKFQGRRSKVKVTGPDYRIFTIAR